MFSHVKWVSYREHSVWSCYLLSKSVFFSKELRLLTFRVTVKSYVLPFCLFSSDSSECIFLISFSYFVSLMPYFIGNFPPTFHWHIYFSSGICSYFFIFNGMLHKFVFYPCVEDMLIFSVLFCFSKHTSVLLKICLSARMALVRRSNDNFNHVSSRGWIQVVRLGSKQFYLWFKSHSLRV